MPDWRRLVQSRLGALGLDLRREAEIAAELAHHHEELFEEYRRQGLSAAEAEARAGAEVSDWQELCQRFA